jgi:hypothetical protein
MKPVLVVAGLFVGIAAGFVVAKLHEAEVLGGFLLLAALFFGVVGTVVMLLDRGEEDSPGWTVMGVAGAFFISSWLLQ